MKEETVRLKAIAKCHENEDTASAKWKSLETLTRAVSVEQMRRSWIVNKED